MGLSIFLLFATYLLSLIGEYGKEQNQFDHLHIIVGHFFLVFFILRLFLGFFEASEFSSSSFQKLWVRPKNQGKDSDLYQFGHFSKAKIAYQLFYFLSFLLIISGLLLSGIIHGKGYFASTFFDELKYLESISFLHFISSIGIVLFIVAHFIGIYKAHKKLKLPIIQSMTHGIQYKYEQEEK